MEWYYWVLISWLAYVNFTIIGDSFLRSVTKKEEFNWFVAYFGKSVIGILAFVIAIFASIYLLPESIIRRVTE